MLILLAGNVDIVGNVDIDDNIDIVVNESILERIINIWPLYYVKSQHFSVNSR